MIRPLCIYHDNCADGFTSAWIVHKALRGEVDFLPAQYGKPLPAPDLVHNRDLIIVDFSYSGEQLDILAGAIHSALILDHHKSARDELAHLPPAPSLPVWASAAWDGQLSGSLRIVQQFDMNRAGAQMTWDWFNPSKPRPPLVEYISDRDLWRFALPMSREINAYLGAHAYNFTGWDQLDHSLALDLDLVSRVGGVIDSKHQRDIAELLKASQRRMTIAGHDVPVANLPYKMASDACPAMSKAEPSAPFAATYMDLPHGRVFSLRSTTVDVSEIAKRYGGGGHPGAAGFTMPLGWEGDP